MHVPRVPRESSGSVNIAQVLTRPPGGVAQGNWTCDRKTAGRCSKARGNPRATFRANAARGWYVTNAEGPSFPEKRHLERVEPTKELFIHHTGMDAEAQRPII